MVSEDLRNMVDSTARTEKIWDRVWSASVCQTEKF